MPQGPRVVWDGSALGAEAEDWAWEEEGAARSKAGGAGSLGDRGALGSLALIRLVCWGRSAVPTLKPKIGTRKGHLL